MRAVGPEMLAAAIDFPSRPVIGAPMAVNPIANSFHAKAQPSQADLFELIAQDWVVGDVEGRER